MNMAQECSSKIAENEIKLQSNAAEIYSQITVKKLGNYIVNLSQITE